MMPRTKRPAGRTLDADRCYDAEYERGRGMTQHRRRKTLSARRRRAAPRSEDKARVFRAAILSQLHRLQVELAKPRGRS